MTGIEFPEDVFYIIIIQNSEDKGSYYITMDPDSAAELVFNAWQKDLDAVVREAGVSELSELGEEIPPQLIIKRIAKMKRLFSKQDTPRKGSGLRRIFRRQR